MSQSTCTGCGRVREISVELLTDMKVVNPGSYTQCIECMLKEYEGIDETEDVDILDAWAEEEKNGYLEFKGPWPFAKENPQIMKRVQLLREKFLTSREGKKRDLR